MPRILFLCVENAGRSQMAEAFARKYAPAGAEIYSAGSAPAKEVHPEVVEAMREIGIDLSSCKPKGWDALPTGPLDVVVGMGCGGACPAVRAKRTFSWDLPNPKGQPLEVVRQIRDQIEQKFQALLTEEL